MLSGSSPPSVLAPQFHRFSPKVFKAGELSWNFPFEERKPVNQLPIPVQDLSASTPVRPKSMMETLRIFRIDTETSEQAEQLETMNSKYQVKSRQVKEILLLRKKRTQSVELPDDSASKGTDRSKLMISLQRRLNTNAKSLNSRRKYASNSSAPSSPLIRLLEETATEALMQKTLWVDSYKEATELKPLNTSSIVYSRRLSPSPIRKQITMKLPVATRRDSPPRKKLDVNPFSHDIEAKLEGLKTPRRVVEKSVKKKLLNLTQRLLCEE
mmetsp:Transcript_6432/g.11213  ORF Transcript_6432/g.11213 Transcript_6432/m.11213 type:complete len:269 (+) Transcript_6432:1-807(+)